MVQPDDNDRTNSMGLFNTAEAFRLSAMALQNAKVDSGHAVKPILFCDYHALELYLKALLRQKHSVKAIRKKLGHNIQRLMKKAKRLGLVIAAKDRDVFSKIDIEAIIEVRYIRTGPKHWPELEEQATDL